MTRFTSVVRRGLRQMLDRRLAWHIERIIENGTRLGLKRGERLTGPEISELRAALAWIEQEAASEGKAEADNDLAVPSPPGTTV